ncbi:hypothetical protein [Neobacillus mesonae]|uniref:hypothetical protein n=1 Tax=Neobacillus mesonae TaxID=1193713 RepID=UPI0020419326|nr:hypothetical protein [Neobacillus mesonae]MCM3566812.1 hypothetical protein [Neobacillus mesonae]
MEQAKEYGILLPSEGFFYYLAEAAQPLDATRQAVQNKSLYVLYWLGLTEGLRFSNLLFKLFCHLSH